MEIIRTKRLILREHTEADIEGLYAIQSDPATMSFWPAPFSYEQTESWIQRQIASYTANGYGRWAVIRIEEGVMIGDAGIVASEIDGKVENDLGYIIHADAWNKGYGYEAAEGCLRYGLDALGLDRLVANMPTDHLASRKVAEKLGMKLEKHFYNKRNRDKETCLYSIGQA
ncbi:GNAT family N-acetyltransferase [Cohnella sp. JJ-181]|uniref:GNAT family N-acetyltransferase n=1 Tax=Cohnella rhizoplanae TaxID=2974897 RepID=UPI0022FF961A|nr:GNAT family N-acetyltransferase [Cohnella sp. JJ-181]CAI6086275.1 Acetyltransferase [Cohnella sp. JJ-181]